MSEFIYLTIGFAFGCAFMLNRKEYRQEKTHEQLDEQLRSEHTMYKNLCASLKNDIGFLKERIRTLQEKK